MPLTVTKRSWGPICAGILALAAAARLLFLGRALLWTDEAYSVHLAHLDLGSLLAKLLSESTPPLYYLLLRSWIFLFGDGALAVRLLSALLGVAAVAALCVVARRFLSPPAAFVAGILLALSPIHIAHSQQARMYPLLCLLAIALAGFGLAYSSTRATRPLVGFAACSLLLLYTHNVALWIVVGCTLAVALETAHARAAGKLLAAQGLMLLGYLPWLTVLVQQFGRQATVLDWFLPYWNMKSPLRHLADTLWSFSFGPFPYLLSGLSPSWGISWPVRAGVLALLALGLVRARREPALRVVVVAAVVASTCAILYSVLVQPVYIPGRTDHYLLPFFLLVLAAGLLALPHRALTWLGVAAYALLSVSVLQDSHRLPSKDFSRAFLQEIRERSRPGDIVVTTGLTFAEAEHALRGLPIRLESYPRSAREHPGYLNWPEVLADPAALAADARELARVGAGLAPENRIWVILVDHPAQAPLVTELESALDLDSDSGEVYAESVIGTPIRLLAWKPRPG